MEQVTSRRVGRKLRVASAEAQNLNHSTYSHSHFYNSPPFSVANFQNYKKVIQNKNVISRNQTKHLKCSSEDANASNFDPNGRFRPFI